MSIKTLSMKESLFLLIILFGSITYGRKKSINDITGDFSECHQNIYIEEQIWFSTSLYLSVTSVAINTPAHILYIFQIFLLFFSLVIFYFFIFHCQNFYCFCCILMESFIIVAFVMLTYKRSFLFTFCIYFELSEHENLLDNSYLSSSLKILSDKYFNCCSTFLLEY